MNTQDLLEQASLDALGLLDEQERAAFETAFRAAPPAVQSQVRREQARFASSEAMLPRVDVPAGLKFRVMSAVREAIQSFNRVETARRVEHTPFLRSLMWNSTPLWRAACIGFATATVTLGVFFSFVSQRVKSIERTGTVVEALGAQSGMSPGLLNAILDRPQQHWFVQRVADIAAARAVITVNPDSGEAHLIVDNLPVQRAQYFLAFTNANDRPAGEPLVSFDATATELSVRAKLAPEADVRKLGIFGPVVEGGATVLIMSIG